MLKRIGMSAVLIAMFSLPVRATDVPIFPKGAIDSTALQSLIWGNSGAQGFNNNYFFTPNALNESVCVFVYNNNTTNPHTFTASINVTGNPNSSATLNPPSGATWQSAASNNGLLAATSPGTPGGLGAQVSGAALVSINLSASSTQAGSPDTANVVIVQTSGNCIAGNNFMSAAPGTVNAVEPIQAVSDGLAQAYYESNSVSSPAAGATLANVNANSGARSQYYQRLRLATTSTTAVPIQYGATTSTGTTCGAATVGNFKGSLSFSSTALTNSLCTVQPSQSGVQNAIIPVGTTLVLDISGFVSQSGSVNGFAVFNGAGAVTGSVFVTVEWYEK